MSPQGLAWQLLLMFYNLIPSLPTWTSSVYVHRKRALSDNEAGFVLSRNLLRWGWKKISFCCNREIFKKKLYPCRLLKEIGWEACLVLNPFCHQQEKRQLRQGEVTTTTNTRVKGGWVTKSLSDKIPPLTKSTSKLNGNIYDTLLFNN